MARELLAYVELFEGRISLTEILTLDYSLLVEMIKLKNEAIEAKNKKALQQQAESERNMKVKQPKKKCKITQSNKL